jgi:hypothetical protein
LDDLKKKERHAEARVILNGNVGMGTVLSASALIFNVLIKYIDKLFFFF